MGPKSSQVEQGRQTPDHEMIGLVGPLRCDTLVSQTLDGLHYGRSIKIPRKRPTDQQPSYFYGVFLHF